MDKLITIESPAAAIMIANVDTDVITPMNRITTRAGKPLSHYAFEPLRYLGGDGDHGEPDPDFALNREIYRSARIMLCGENFGCGSSRETAPAAIADLGFRCLIGSSFGDIFHNNCFQQGILPVTLEREQVERLARLSEHGEVLLVDLPGQQITAPDGSLYQFEVNSLRKKSLVEGLDDIALTLTMLQDIDAWQEADEVARPWVYHLSEES